MKKINILYLSCHSILEFDELRMLTEFDEFDVFSIGGYIDMKMPHSDMRPALTKDTNPAFKTAFAEMCKTKPEGIDAIYCLTSDFVNNFDVIIVMHIPDILDKNWDVIKHKTVIWRSIGQSTIDVERRLLKYRNEGLKIIRYSPIETEIPEYIGHDAIIRFGKYPSDFLPWVGDKLEVITFAQNMFARNAFCNYSIMKRVCEQFDYKVYGPNNTNLGRWAGGCVPYSKLAEILSQHRVYFYTGTWPASYTLNFIEALMAGIPIVSIGYELASKLGKFPFEVPTILETCGFVSNDPDDLKYYIRKLFGGESTILQGISNDTRIKALELFDANRIKHQWRDFLNTCI